MRSDINSGLRAALAAVALAIAPLAGNAAWEPTKTVEFILERG